MLYSFFIYHPYVWAVIAVILGMSVISLRWWLMAELVATYNDAIKRFFNLIDFVPSDKSVREKNKLQSQTFSDEVNTTEEVQRKLFLENVDWSRYNLQIQASLIEIKHLIQLAFDYKTGTINDYNLFNESIKKLNEFVIKYWLEIEDEDHQMFELMAIELINLASIKKAPLKAFYYLKKMIQTRIVIFWRKLVDKNQDNRSSSVFIKFDSKFKKMYYENSKGLPENNIFYKIVNNMIIFANTVLRLSGKYDLIDESLYFVKALDKVDPVTEEDNNLPWEDHMILSNAYIRRQAALFKSLPKRQLLPYKNQYVFFEEGEIKDYDNNREDLIERVYETVGYRAILVKKVNLESKFIVFRR